MVTIEGIVLVYFGFSFGYPNYASYVTVHSQRGLIEVLMRLSSTRTLTEQTSTEES